MSRGKSRYRNTWGDPNKKAMIKATNTSLSCEAENRLTKLLTVPRKTTARQYMQMLA